jgi:hypothetical protein
MLGVAAFTVSDNVKLPVPLALVAFKVTLKAPVCVGVPEIAPLAVFNVNPVGNVPVRL